MAGHRHLITLGLRLCLLLSLAGLVACGADRAAPQTNTPSAADSVGPRLDTGHKLLMSLQFSADIPDVPRQRIATHLTALGFDTLTLDDADAQLPGSGHVWLIGDTPLARRYFGLLSPTVAEEGYELRHVEDNGRLLYLSRGRDGGSTDLTPEGPAIGTLYAAYELLEQLGMRFLHPLQPTVGTRPDALPHPSQEDAPRWPIRTWHLHTQHPLELTHVLNGWGPAGPADAAGWETLLPEWERFLEWSIANRQNRVSWFLLMATSWQTFADSPERQQRLQRLASMAHAWGIATGIDAPIAFRQQHAWTMIREEGNEIAQIRDAVAWLQGAGADFLEIEMGFSEFTHPSDRDMLDWMNEAALHARHQFGMPVYVKAHCSQKQVAESFTDPETGKPLNFNFLAYHATPELGVMPHTVQYYDLKGPVYTYDNENFHYMRRYMQMEAGRREVLWYPETAYWVNVDIDVPLFLPIYAKSRLDDLRLIASDEREGRMGRGEHAGSRIQGQVNFSSGWEWGYWLNDVVTARAAWNPQEAETDDARALSSALQPFTSLLGDAGSDADALLQQWIQVQSDLVWRGQRAGQPDARREGLNAQAYLQGWDTWSEITKRLGSGETQARSMGMIDLWNPLLPAGQRVDYRRGLRPLLAETADALTSLHQRFAALESRVPAHGKALYDEIRDAMEITALRAAQVRDLYRTSWLAGPFNLPLDRNAARESLGSARAALDRARQLADERERHYRADPQRIAGWGYNPTAYRYGYLWTVRSLYFWWRDEAKAVDRPLSPGYLNFKDPVDIANGEGEWRLAGIDLRRLRDWVGGSNALLREILFGPIDEPRLPPAGLRERPRWK